ncbi:MAG: general secretion pathway protein GspK [Phycisphaeraceae bacterium]|nr:general secretion pathway protein GspK [Phycisphaeraceae bacterium]
MSRNTYRFTRSTSGGPGKSRTLRVRSGRTVPGSASGAVLVLTMWLLLIIGLTLLGLNRVTAVSRARSHGQLQRVQAHWLARAGVEKALDLLSFDVTSDDGPLDYWYDSPDDFAEVPLADGYTYSVLASQADDPTLVRYGLIDEASKINVNFASRNLLLGIDGISEELVDCLIDWRDRNDTVRPGGAERGYYSQLDFPYEIRNGNLHTQREMLLVRGMDDASFFGDATHPPLAALTTVWSYDPPTLPDGRQRVYLRRANAGELVNRFNFTQSLAEKVVEEGRNADSIFDLVSVRGDNDAQVQPGQINQITLEWLANHVEELSAASNQNERTAKININTAPKAVLEALSGMDDRAVANLISARAGSGGFINVGELLTRGIFSSRQFRRNAELLTVRSNVLKVVSIGATPDGISASIEAVLDRSQTNPVILYWHQSE